MKISRKSTSLNEEDFLNYLGAAVSSRRLKQGLSQLQVADNAGLTRSYVSDVERGLRNITLLTLCGIAEALDCTCTELLNDVDKFKRAEKRER